MTPFANHLARHGPDSPPRRSCSDHVCTALQLRDLDTLNRVYIPEEDRRRFGYADADCSPAGPHPRSRG